MATKSKATGSRPDDLDESLDLFYEHARQLFIHNVAIIARNEKPERIIKMLQSCPELKPVTRSNKALWQLLQKVRREVMNGSTATGKAAGKKPVKAKN